MCARSLKRVKNGHPERDMSFIALNMNDCRLKFFSIKLFQRFFIAAMLHVSCKISLRNLK